jgi:hypothetical protein
VKVNWTLTHPCMLVEASLYIFIHFGLMYCFLNLHDAEYPYTLFFVKKYENKLGPACHSWTGDYFLQK